ncbi:methylenetetrahydrofolate reductase [NAD(P)H] [Austwickia chelonae]|uniref:Methylenetetrahydrofolate reductase n=1 Tax=Austwickia chelonae NBRC 105200 TaxID=1184607 RepID=K6W716_9MICO|nr:methylenetetrahydrofolate reductase [NAD(P)H] [Austwickia chelonae]GAB77617.1 5,10-methylenetetrahydrofolate reductase [Austwickia chelonae NBRC 105200]
MSRPSIPDLLSAPEATFSFEFFPPKSDAAEDALWHAIRRLEPVSPAFVSVTYGAGGSTRDRTVRVTERIAKETTLRPMAHLTCVSSSVDQLREVVGQYAAGGVRDVLALRGDPPGSPGTPWTPHPEGLDHAEDLVRLLRSLGDFTVGVAAFPDKHPESADLDADADVLARKFEAGAEFAVTQFAFDVDSYTRLRDRLAARGWENPIVPGLMPVTSYKQVSRMAELSGTSLPAAVVARLAPLEEEPEALRAEGVQIATELAESLLAEGAPGLHFYTMNRSTATLQVYRNLVGGAPELAVPLQVRPDLLRGGVVASVLRIVHAVDAQDWRAVRECLCERVVAEFPAQGVRIQGAETLMGVIPGAFERLSVERVVYDGGLQAVLWISRDGAGGERVHDALFICLDHVGRIESVVALRPGT